MWVNNDFGKGGRDNFVKEMAARNIKVVADISTESGQADFSADVVKVKAANADAIFVYSMKRRARASSRRPRSRASRRRSSARPRLLGQKVIDLAGDAAERRAGSCRAHRRRADPGGEGVRRTFKKQFNYVCDHNGIKGYTAVYFIKYVTEKIGKFDSKAFAKRCTA